MKQQRVSSSLTRLRGFDEFADEHPAPAYGEPNELIRRLPEVFVVSDTHFFHHNIIKFQDRPWNVDRLMMERWNATVGRDRSRPALWRCGPSLHH